MDLLRCRHLCKKRSGKRTPLLVIHEQEHHLLLPNKDVDLLTGGGRHCKLSELQMEDISDGVERRAEVKMRSITGVRLWRIQVFQDET